MQELGPFLNPKGVSMLSDGVFKEIPLPHFRCFMMEQICAPGKPHVDATLTKSMRNHAPRYRDFLTDLKASLIPQAPQTLGTPHLHAGVPLPAAVQVCGQQVGQSARCLRLLLSRLLPLQIRQLGAQSLDTAHHRARQPPRPLLKQALVLRRDACTRG